MAAALNMCHVIIIDLPPMRTPSIPLHARIGFERFCLVVPETPALRAAGRIHGLRGGAMSYRPRRPPVDDRPCVA
jgi:hypothetical protein